MLVFSPSRTTPMRQTVVTGRVSDAVSGLGAQLVSADLAFSYTLGGTPHAGRIPTKLHVKPAGFYALALEPGMEWPDFPSGITVTLTVSIKTADGTELSTTIDQPADDLALESRALTLDGMTLQTERIKAAPFDASFKLTPDPILLRADVLFDADPDTPVPDATIRLDGTLLAERITNGRMSIPLDATGTDPAKRTLVLTPVNGPATEFTIYPDFTKPLNTRVFSIPGTT